MHFAYTSQHSLGLILTKEALYNTEIATENSLIQPEIDTEKRILQRNFLSHLNSWTKYHGMDVNYYSWNVTNHMRPTISGPDLPYQAPTYNIGPRHTISGPQTMQRFRSCSKRFSPRTASKIHEHLDQQNGTKLFFPQLCD